MPEYLELFFKFLPQIACYSAAAFVGLGIAIVELLGRYGAGNHPIWVLSGNTQKVYYLVNIFAAWMGLFVSETLGETKIVEIFANDPALAILKSCGIGLASMFALRSSLFTVNNKDDKAKVDVGPAYVINLLNRYLERQIDQQRGTFALKEVYKIMQNVDPEFIDPDLTTICLSVPETIPKEDLERLREELNILSKQVWKSPKTKSVAMGIQIQKEVGVHILKAAVETLISLLPLKATESPLELQVSDAVDNWQQDVFSSSDSSVLESALIDDELEKKLQKLRGD